MLHTWHISFAFHWSFPLFYFDNGFERFFMVSMMRILTRKGTEWNVELVLSIKKLSTKRGKKLFTFFLLFLGFVETPSWEWSKVVKLHKAIWHKSKFKKVLSEEIKLDFEFSYGKLRRVSRKIPSRDFLFISAFS